VLGKEAGVSKEDIRRASLDEVRAMKDRSEVYEFPDALEGPDLGEGFWDEAVWEPPRAGKRSVHLKLDPAVFDWFVQETGGTGHITRMQAVLKAYADTKAKSKLR
jgi:uncharacterized protein (DUF4415 family)